MSLVARSEERRHKCTVNYLQRLYFNNIFKKKEKDNGSRADVVAKRKKDHISDVKEGSRAQNYLFSQGDHWLLNFPEWSPSPKSQ